MSRDLLIELGTEELPPKALPTLSAALTEEFVRQLDEAGLNHGEVESFAAPRRLAVLVRGLDDKQADRDIERQGPAVQAAFDKDGNPTKAAQGFASSLGLTVDQLGRQDTGTGERLVNNELRHRLINVRNMPGQIELQTGNGSAVVWEHGDIITYNRPHV